MDIPVRTPVLDAAIKQAKDGTPAHNALVTARQIHWRRSQVFYDRKKDAGQLTRESPTTAAFCFDFWKNFSVPNISTNDVYYKRQLSLYTFDCHDLESDHDLFSYDQTVGKKGSTDLVSMLNILVKSIPLRVKDLHFFCDSSAGQNKNWLMFRYLYHLVHIKKRFSNMHVTFLIRGLSYMECDRDTGRDKMTLKAEVPADWMRYFREAQKDPRPFIVEQPGREDFFNYEHELGPLFFAEDKDDQDARDFINVY